MAVPHSLVSSSAKADDPVRRGLSIQKLLPLEYRIARSRPGDDSGKYS
jgi:hypothetical protein